jgi:Immune inhibitor A-like, MAM domain
VRRFVVGLVVTGLALVVAAVTVGTATAGTVTAAAPGNGKEPKVKNVGPNYNHGKKLGLSEQESESVKGQPPQGNAKVGAVRTWLALDDFNNSIYLKNYTLRGVGDHIEVWVANNLAFPGNDCRNSLGLTTVTDAQVQSFIGEFDSNIYPKESEAFSVPPDRDGHKALLPTLIPNLPSSEYKGEGDNIVVLVDNVRDANYYAPGTPDGQTYIAGFFYSVFNDYTNRNVMTIDAYDWLHRTGANPPDNSGDADYQACPYASGAPRPHLYEGVFAHEYQHLLEHYSDPDEVSWVNEGLSDWAQTLVGYVDPNVPQNPAGPGADSHFGCFEGWLDPSFGGPENSLTSWGDQGGPEILCDYGAAYSIMQMLATRYGDSFMSALHKDPGNGLAGLDDVLGSFATGKTSRQVIHEWAALMALDNQAGSSLTGGSTDDYTSPGLWSTINWDNSQAYDAPGAPANGSDYVPLGPVSGLSSIDFQGSATLPPTPVAWTSVTDAPDRSGDAVLFSGAANNRDEAIVRDVTFGSSPKLTFDARWNEETGWDFGFVQVSTDEGATYSSLSCTDTTSDHDPGALPTAVQNVPGFTGDSGGWKTETCDVSAYAGQTVVLSFRAFNDPGTLGATGAVPPGFWVDNVMVDDALVSDGGDPADWQSPTQRRPTAVSGFTVQLVAYDDSGNAWIAQLPLDASFDGSLDAGEIAAALGTSATTVGALVMYDEPTESILAQAPYTLTVNGTPQQGGS